jgi:coenzyme F420 biosynthesis associated uncharacterized protein
MPTELVDWDLALSTAQRLAGPGPRVERAEADAVVLDLRCLADEAGGHVERYTRLTPHGAPPPVVVVDRNEWARSNVAGLRAVTRPLLGKLSERAGPGWTTSVGRRLTGVQIGVALAYLSTKVLGQYEVFLPESDGTGRLSLVAPNIVEVERILGVHPTDFRMWVCLHEQTHRLQFAAVPWLRGHLEAEVHAFAEVTDLEPGEILRRAREGVAAVRGAVLRSGDRPTSLLEAIQTPEQRVVLNRLQALMTLLEGHADQVMDAVGPKVVPSVAEIRRRFEVRRDAASPIERLVRRLLGLDMKLRQYRQGGAFVRAVVDDVGVEAFNRVWTSPETLPTLAEFADPPRWMDRVLGYAPTASA